MASYDPMDYPTNYKYSFQLKIKKDKKLILMLKDEYHWEIFLEGLCHIMYIETLCKYNKLLGNVFMQTVRELEPKCSFVSLVKYYN